MDQVLSRTLDIDATRRDDSSRTVEASLSSGTLVERFFGFEKLSHGHDAVNLDRARDGNLPLLFNHDSNTPIGAAERVRVEGGKLRARLRFGNTEKATEIWSLVRDKLITGVSIGYQIDQIERTGEQDGMPVMEATRWTLLEASIAPVAADPNVGVGRSHQPKLTLRGSSTMEDQTTLSPMDQERERIAEMLRAGEHFPDLAPFAREAISSGMPLEEFNAGCLTRMRAGNKPLPAPSSDIGLSPSEQGQYSFMRLIRAQLDHSKFGQDAGLEIEASQAVARKLGKQPQGLYVPAEILRRDMSVSFVAK